MERMMAERGGSVESVPEGVWWLLPGFLAGARRPDRLDPPGAAGLAGAGFTHLVSLTAEWAPPRGALVDAGVALIRLEIGDMHVPRMADLAETVARIEAAVAAGGRVCVHCAAGQGRTGLVLAAVLVAQGESAPDALARVRAANPRAVETEGQEAMLARFADRLARFPSPG